MSRPFAFLVPLILATALCPSTTQACICDTGNEPSLDQVRRWARSVFMGEVVFVAPVAMDDELVTFLVERAWKGVDDEIVTISNHGQKNCRTRFEVGTKYVVYAGDPEPSRPDRRYFCTRLHEAADGKWEISAKWDMKTLREPGLVFEPDSARRNAVREQLLNKWRESTHCVESVQQFTRPLLRRTSHGLEGYPSQRVTPDGPIWARSLGFGATGFTLVVENRGPCILDVRIASTASGVLMATRTIPGTVRLYPYDERLVAYRYDRELVGDEPEPLLVLEWVESNYPGHR